MKVFHVLTHFMPSQTAGTEMYVYALQHQLQRLGHTGGVIIPDFYKKSVIEYNYKGINVFGYSQDSIMNDRVIKGIEPPSGLNAFERLLDNLCPDILHFHELNGSNGLTFFHIEVARRRRIPIIITMHVVGYVCATGTLIKNAREKCNGLISDFQCTRCSFIHQGLSFFSASSATFASKLTNKTGLSVYSRSGKIAGLLGRIEMIKRHKKKLHNISAISDYIVALNDWFANMLIQNGVPSAKVKVIKQAIPDLDININVNRNEAVSNGEPLRIIFVGRIFPAKGVHLLLEALKDITPEKYILDIYGPSNDKEYHDKCVQLAGGNMNIKFCGVIPPGETIKCMGNYDLLCLPSIVTEMAPLVIQEAFAAGIPVLASDVYGNAAYIEHMINGLLFSVGNSRDLSRNINNLIDQPELLSQLKKRVISNSSFKDVCESYLKIYNSFKTYGK